MKNILIITYYWPPAGGAPVFRWLNFSKELLKKGYNPIILTTKNGDYQFFDNEIEVPNNIEVHRTFTPSIYKITSKFLKNSESIPYGSFETTKEDSKLKKLFLWARINLIAPDIRRFWNHFAYNKALELIKTKNIKIVITTGPPHSTHLIGFNLKKNFNINWITDFRDGWTTSAYMAVVKRNNIIIKYDKFLEKKVLSNCDKIITCTKTLFKDFNHEEKNNLIYNNYNPDDFKNINPHQFSDFSINHFGTITQGSDFTPLKKVALKMQNIKFRFWGKIEKNIIQEIKSDPKIAKFFDFYPPISHNKVLELLLGSPMLLLFITNVRNNVLTLKIFEYLGAKKPILGIGPINSEPAEILTHTNSGKMFNYDEIENICNFIKKTMKNKNLFKGEKSYQYSLPFLTEKLIEIIESF